MTRVNDILYSPVAGEWGRGDCHLSHMSMAVPNALVIHGGSWLRMDKTSMSGMSEFICGLGCTAFNINYRLIGSHPWPACLDDCLRAGEFIINGEHEFFGQETSAKVLVVGSSAGGHLALMTALQLPRELVAGVISMAGPSDLPLLRSQGFGEKRSERFWNDFFGTDDEITDEMLAAVSPVNLVTPDSPPMLLIHNTRDKNVDISHSERMAEACKQNGVRAELYRFDGEQENHDLWLPDTRPPELRPELAQRVSEFISSL